MQPVSYPVVSRAVLLTALSLLLFGPGCSDDNPVEVDPAPASLHYVIFPSAVDAAWQKYVPGDTVSFKLSNDNHSLEEGGGTVLADGEPVLDFYRIDSTVYEPSVGHAVDYTTPLDYSASLSADRRTIRCTFTNISEESLAQGNIHEWYLHLPSAIGNDYRDYRDAFFMQKE